MYKIVNGIRHLPDSEVKQLIHVIKCFTGYSACIKYKKAFKFKLKAFL
jgi:hypothetical protein